MNCASTCTLKINNVKLYDVLLNSENFITCMIKIWNQTFNTTDITLQFYQLLKYVHQNDDIIII